MLPLIPVVIHHSLAQPTPLLPLLPAVAGKWGSSRWACQFLYLWWSFRVRVHLQYWDVFTATEEHSVLYTLLPSSSLPAETNDNSYDISVPPLIGSTVPPYFNLATETTHQVAPVLPSELLHSEASVFISEDRSDDTPYEDVLQCTSCTDTRGSNAYNRGTNAVASTTVAFGAALYLQLIAVAAARLAPRPTAASKMG